MNRILPQHIWDHMKALLLLLVLPIAGSGYVYLNNADRGFRILYTQVDYAIPFVKYFAVPYLFWIVFLYICLIYFCFRDRTMYYRMLFSYAAGVFICYMFYYFFQTTVPRPVLVGDDIFTWMVSKIYGSDQPFNAFPSIHCFSSFLMLSGILRSKVRNRLNTLLIGSTAMLIIASTLFVKQHVILDALSGIIVAELVFALSAYMPFGEQALRRSRSVSHSG
ncbi:phosphatase PAP2 family protein [Paenibacillus turpanensis]|uniref:phosphatase PAP2 family protein n=1 Tax=Paenibacillus turpanensis TaxID=2689078 RepID=UPI0014089FA7|nr:phosphatase PAP2 family protein [Paenibacillus turpanensis]